METSLIVVITILAVIIGAILIYVIFQLMNNKTNILKGGEMNNAEIIGYYLGLRGCLSNLSDLNDKYHLFQDMKNVIVRSKLGYEEIAEKLAHDYFRPIFEVHDLKTFSADDVRDKYTILRLAMDLTLESENLARDVYRLGEVTPEADKIFNIIFTIIKDFKNNAIRMQDQNGNHIRASIIINRDNLPRVVN